jgi:transposase
MVMAYEASACGFVLRDEAEAMKIACWVLAPTKMEKSVEQKKQKNDDRDADDIVEKLRGHVLAGNRLPTVWVPDRQTRDDRELIRTRLELADKQTQVKSQIQMLLKRHGLEKPSGCKAGWSVKYRGWLKALKESEELGWGVRQGLASLLRQLGFIEGEIDGMEEPVQQLAAAPRHQKIIEELTQESGVGRLTALVYRTEIGEAGRFRRGRQVGKFTGLTPTSHESGQQNDRKGHISRQGPPRLRKMLCQAAWAQVRHDEEARKIYQKLVSRNPKKKKIALVAMMRRLAVRLWHRMRKIELELTAA